MTKATDGAWSASGGPTSEEYRMDNSILSERRLLLRYSPLMLALSFVGTRDAAAQAAPAARDALDSRQRTSGR